MPRGIPRNKSLERQILTRFKIAQGHLNKVIAMVENGDYCIDVVHQSCAVCSAIKKINKLILTNHLKTCAVAEIKKGKVDSAIDEVVGVINKYEE